jgi:hypothetical protein
MLFSPIDVPSLSPLFLARQWYWDCRLFCLKSWHTLFDAREESLSSLPIWIKLPNLPKEFWSDKGFRAIGEVLGNYIIVDKRYKSSNYCWVAQILVDVDPRNGLYESMDIVLGDKTYTQQLDYLHLPFRCARCHHVGHMHAECELGFQNIIQCVARDPLQSPHQKTLSETKVSSVDAVPTKIDESFPFKDKDLEQMEPNAVPTKIDESFPFEDKDLEQMELVQKHHAKPISSKSF